MAIEQIVAYLKENQSRYSTEQLRQALLKAGHPVQEIDEAINITAGKGTIESVRAKLESAAGFIETPHPSSGKKIILWICGFISIGILSGLGGAIIGFLSFLIFFFGRGVLPITPDIFGLYFYQFVLGIFVFVAEIVIFLRLRRRFIYFSRGMLSAIILQAIIAILIAIIFIAIIYYV